jgi:adenylate cyclase
MIVAEPSQRRKLAAILSADVVGYSKLMADDESATVATLKEYRAAVERVINRHDGRIVNAPGDNMLAEFASAVEAVQAAVEIQRSIEGRNVELPEDRRMRFRVGLNLGDVIEEDDGTIYGDGVNIAARMEALADEGGICISSTIHDAVEGKLDFGFDFLGEQQVKNIEKPVRVYRVRAEAREPEPAPTAPTRRRTGAIIAAAAVAVVLVAGGVIWALYPKAPAQEPAVATEETAGEPIARGKPAIAVLPFTNMSDDAEQEYFTDGISEDLITELSRFDGLLVIARNSTFRFKGQAVDVAEVAAALGVRYVLEGGVRREGDRVRITAQLIDAETGGHLWAERYDRELADVFAVQDDVTRQIIAALRSELSELTPTRGNRALTSNTEAYDLYLQARVLKGRRTQETNRQAQQMFLRAIDLDPAFAAAYADLGFTRFLARVYDWTDEEDISSDALAAAEKAVALDPLLPLAHDRLGLIRGFQGDLDAGIAAAREAIALDANYANGYSTLALMLACAGETDEAISLLDRALRLDPYSALALFYRGVAYFVREDYDQAITALKSSLALNPNFGAAHRYLAAIYGLLGRDQEARAEAAEVLRLSPDKFARGILLAPFGDRADLLRLIDGQRKAGLDIPAIQWGQTP